MCLGIHCVSRKRRSWRGARGRTLVLSVASLHLFVFAFLDFALQHASPLWLIKPCDFQNLRRVEPGIRAPSHHRDPFAHPARVKL